MCGIVNTNVSNVKEKFLEHIVAAHVANGARLQYTTWVVLYRGVKYIYQLSLCQVLLKTGYVRSGRNCHM